jgi:hypothetical protein
MTFALASRPLVSHSPDGLVRSVRRDNAEILAHQISRWAMRSRDTEAVRVLENAAPFIESQPCYLDGDVERWLYDHLTLHLGVGEDLFDEYEPKRDGIERRLLGYAGNVVIPEQSRYLRAVRLGLKFEKNDGWRYDASMWLIAQAITNQGRVRSNNVAPLEFEGLKFRSYTETIVYRELKRRGHPVAPLPVVIQGGETYERREPDFLIIYRGRVIIIEVHGPLSDASDERLAYLARAGAIIHHLAVDRCSDTAAAKTAIDEVFGRVDRIIV